MLPLEPDQVKARLADAQWVQSPMLEQGHAAPDMLVRDHSGTEYPLSTLYNQAPLVLFFYPGDFTPMCTAQACGLRDSYASLTDAGVRVAGVNPGSTASHAKFRERYDLPYPLLTDQSKKLSKAFGVGSYFGLTTRRASFLIDTDGTIIDSVRADLSLAAHDAFVQRVIHWATQRKQQE